ncbi:MAG: amino acid adenylation protein, partial [Micromonosporaceae bacterium]|nr:amino acid adenylation protein [Micromonosporaceae bacterium]
AGGPFQVPTKPRQWPDARRLAGVSSFGVGGTNAHVLVEQAPPAGTVAGSSRARVAHQRPGQSGGHLLPVSARTPQALRAALVRLRAALPAAELEDVGYTLALGRRHFTQRAAVAGTDLAGILDALDHLLQTGSAVAGTPGPLLDRAVAWVGGEDLDWAALAPAGRRVPLPGYPFQRRRYWIDPPDRARRR